MRMPPGAEKPAYRLELTPEAAEGLTKLFEAEERPAALRLYVEGFG
ncbi:MAG: hypothetical protein P1V51_06845 [Deltaproteobacteria bacterium]|nr:hypothetical protein [Deltaproteobacteria bacterium]